MRSALRAFVFTVTLGAIAAGFSVPYPSPGKPQPAPQPGKTATVANVARVV